MILYLGKLVEILVGDSGSRYAGFSRLNPTSVKKPFLPDSNLWLFTG
jgi:hypothetical protein